MLVQPKILSIPDTINYLKEHRSSIARFGDGEMEIISGTPIAYQEYDPQLATELKVIMSTYSNEDFVVGLSDVYDNLERYNDYARQFWQVHLTKFESNYNRILRAPWYGNTFISRPYMDLINKEMSTHYFHEIRSLWEDLDVLIVEGINSRSGVGNDLFENTHTLTRIIGPSSNAYRMVDELEETILNYAQGKLVLLMLGPTAKVLAFRLAKKGIWAVDLGHIDSEYEWYLQGAETKVKLPNKHTAEHNYDENITFTQDSKYNQSIIVHLTEGE